MLTDFGRGALMRAPRRQRGGRIEQHSPVSATPLASVPGVPLSNPRRALSLVGSPQTGHRPKRGAEHRLATGPDLRTGYELVHTLRFLVPVE